MERWLWFLLIAAACVASYDYGRRTEREIPLKAALSLYQERDALKEELKDAREAREKAVADTAARVARESGRDRKDASATNMVNCPVPPELEQLLIDRDKEANRIVADAYRGKATGN